MPPSGLPTSFLEGGERAAARARRSATRKGRGPFTTAQANERFGVDVEAVLPSSSARRCSSAASCVPAAASASGATPTCCGGSAERRSRRSGKEVEPAEQAALGRFLPSWHGIDRRATLREALVPLQGLALPVSLWESEVLPRRVPGYQPAQLDQLCASGEVVWVGAGLDRVAVYFRDDAPVLGRSAGAPRARGRGARRDPRARSAASALFWFDLLAETGLETEQALPALWDLVWAGEVTNDAWPPLRAGRRYGSPRSRSGGRGASRVGARAEITATQGRWSRTERLFSGQRPTAARSPSSCSSVRGSSPATASAARGFPAATAPSTAS